MPENFSSLLEALNTEGRTLARPAPSGVIETLGRARRRRRRFTAVTSAVAVCAVAAGVALSAGGATGRPTPITPVSPAAASSSASKSVPDHVVAPKNRVGADALMQPAEPPQPAGFKWKLTSHETVTDSQPGAFTFTAVCGAEGPSQPLTLSSAQTLDRGEYTAAADGSEARETIFHYSSAAAARKDYDLVKPDQTTCPTVNVVGTVPDGFAWEDLLERMPQDKMIVLSGSDIAYWVYQYEGSADLYDTSADQAALQRMADRLEGRTPIPDPTITSPTNTPTNTLPDSAWLDASQIPFATADQSHGWVPLGGQQQSAGGNPASNLCKAVTEGDDFVSQPSMPVTTRSFHGTPPNTPVYPGSNYLYSSAYQHILTSPLGPAGAQMAFAWTRQILVAHGCQFTDGSGAQVTRKIKIATVTDTGFSLLATDTPGPGYEHLYCVIKGSHVAWTVVGFEQGDTSTDGDAAILANMAAHLP